MIGEAAFVVCHEAIDDAELIATNVFVREGGRWKLVHHQAGQMSARRPATRPRRSVNRGSSTEMSRGSAPRRAALV